MTNNESAKNKGLAAQTANPSHNSFKSNFNDNSAHNQRLKLFDWLLEKGSITTAQAREGLDVYFAPARIFELRDAGYQISTVYETWISQYGIKHTIGRYVLTQKTPIDSEINSEVTQWIYTQLLNRAYALCMKSSSHAIVNDLHYMTEGELIGVINFLVQLQAT